MFDTHVEYSVGDESTIHEELVASTENLTKDDESTASTKKPADSTVHDKLAKSTENGTTDNESTASIKKPADPSQDEIDLDDSWTVV